MADNSKSGAVDAGRAIPLLGVGGAAGALLPFDDVDILDGTSDLVAVAAAGVVSLSSVNTDARPPLVLLPLVALVRLTGVAILVLI